MWNPWRTWRTIARVGDVRGGGRIAIEVDGTELILGLDAGRYYVMQRRCPHRGADLLNAMVSRGDVICPQHGWRFSTTTGQVMGRMNHCTLTHRVRVVGDEIQIDLKPRTVARVPVG